MRKTFIMYILFLLYMEIVFHIACFKSFSLSSTLFIFFVSIIIAWPLTIVSSLFKNEKVNTIIMRAICGMTVLIFSAELVYYSIYESFFSFNGIQFAGVLKDGYDKILLTIFQNTLYILLFVIPTVVFLIKIPKVKKINHYDTLLLSMFMIVCALYTVFSIEFVNRNNENSLYNIVHLKNVPIQSVHKMGLFSTAMLSLERKIFGFNPKILPEEDILINKRTFLVDKVEQKYNINNSIDLKQLAEKETNETIKNLHNYFNNQEPTEQNKFTGLFQEKNVIFILAESFDEIAINPELTPTLYKLKNEGIVFNNYFSPKYPASTADGEYMLEWATLPIIGEDYSLIDMVYNVNPYILPRVLKKYSYKTYVYHDYVGYYNRRSTYFSTLDFDGHRYCNEGINMKCEFFHGSDMDMMDQTIDDFINQDRFFAYYITLSGHGSYDSSNFVAEKHLDKVKNLPYSSQIKYYIAANIDFDLAMNQLITKLKNSGKLNDTLIVISSDHSPYYLSNKEVNSVSKIDRDNKFDRNRGSLIIYNSVYKGNDKIDKYAMNIDVLPTVLNMLNIPYDSRLMIGRDIMAQNHDGLVVFPDRSWVNNKGSYDVETSRFTPYVESIDDKYITKITNEVNEKYNISVAMQYNDYYKYVFR